MSANFDSKIIQFNLIKSMPLSISGIFLQLIYIN